MKKLVILISFFISIFDSSLFSASRFLSENNFSCSGKFKTVLYDYPLKVKLENNKLSWEIEIPPEVTIEEEITSIVELFDGKNIREGATQLLVGVKTDPVTKYFSKRKNIELGVKYSDGVFVDQIDENKISITWIWINGTLIKDQCHMEMPIENDTIKKIIPLLPKM